ncbi:unnamed protein product [Macrosiphum euphorbiae]|uniref:Uncharacterized protein n=1 Tax=Macrosiphum euphorbiae TaxID=13131 RepID=A0AAV0Y8Y1_9HEMI|nr:unnamed protein product [Macrosiphum euphorbiae]
MSEIVLSSKTIFEEISEACGSFAVAHCVSEDLQMSRGVAVQFKLKDLGINSLIIPKLGCTLDGLNWYQVHGLLKNTFDGSDELKFEITVCDPENFQIPSHHPAPIEEKSIDFFDFSTTSSINNILPVEITCASTNNMFQKCLTNKLLTADLWATVRLGQVVRVRDNLVIWAIQGDNVTFFQTLETQINETVAMGLNSSIWTFPKSEMIHYNAFLSLLRSQLADNERRYGIVVSDRNMTTQVNQFRGKWPRISTSHRFHSPNSNNAIMVHQRDQTSCVRGRGGRLAGRGGRDGSAEHNMSTAIYSEALRSIVSVG